MNKSGIILSLVILLVSAGCKPTPKFNLEEEDLYWIYRDLEESVDIYYYIYLDYPKSVDELIKYKKFVIKRFKEEGEDYDIEHIYKSLYFLQTNKDFITIKVEGNQFQFYNKKDDAYGKLERNYCFKEQTPWDKEFYYRLPHRYIAFDKHGEYLWDNHLQSIEEIEDELRQKYPIEVTTEVNGETVPRLIVFKYDKKGNLIIPCEEDSDLDFRNDPYLKDLLSLLDNYFSKYKKAHSIRVLTGLRK